MEIKRTNEMKNENDKILTIKDILFQFLNNCQMPTIISLFIYYGCLQTYDDKIHGCVCGF